VVELLNDPIVREVLTDAVLYGAVAAVALSLLYVVVDFVRHCRRGDA
jgi:hypothetical protein